VRAPKTSRNMWPSATSQPSERMLPVASTTSGSCGRKEQVTIRKWGTRECVLNASAPENGVVGLILVRVVQTRKERLEIVLLVLGDDEPRQDFTLVRTVAPVVEQSHIPVVLEAVKELPECAGRLRELESADTPSIRRSLKVIRTHRYTRSFGSWFARPPLMYRAWALACTNSSVNYSGERCAGCPHHLVRRQIHGLHACHLQLE
jgi:hypothetical protein